MLKVISTSAFLSHAFMRKTDMIFDSAFRKSAAAVSAVVCRFGPRRVATFSRNKRDGSSKRRRRRQRGSGAAAGD
jgi:hypothetical protein